MDIPITYRPLNLATASSDPVGVNYLNNAIAAFYSRYLMKRAISAFKFTLPKEWSKTYFKYTLFCRGFGAIIDYKGIGVIFQGGHVYGRDMYYQPKRFILANPALESKEYNIWGTSNNPNCVLVKLQPDYSGLMDVVTVFASRIALAYEAWTMNTQNSKLAYVGVFDKKAGAKSFDALFDQIQAGKPAVAVGGSLFDENGNPKWFTFSQDLRANYIAPEISADIRNILNEFDSFVGIPNNPDFGKKERSIVDGVNANNVETDTLLDQMIVSIREGFDAANEFFGEKLKTKLEVEKRYPIDKGGDKNDG